MKIEKINPIHPISPDLPRHTKEELEKQKREAAAEPKDIEDTVDLSPEALKIIKEESGQ
jgi:anti-sigma28 factor (negative regulator of flagellin synthesis)